MTSLNYDIENTQGPEAAQEYWCNLYRICVEQVSNRICQHCGLIQDNERYYFPRYGYELCRECAEDEAWYEDQAVRHRLQRERGEY